MVEPAQSVYASYPSLYKSAMLAGDMGNAAMIRCQYCIMGFCIGGIKLTSLTKQVVMCKQQLVSSIFLSPFLSYYVVIICQQL